MGTTEIRFRKGTALSVTRCISNSSNKAVALMVHEMKLSVQILPLPLVYLDDLGSPRCRNQLNCNLNKLKNLVMLYVNVIMYFFV